MARLRSRINSRQTLRFCVASRFGILTAEDRQRLIKHRCQIVPSLKFVILAKQVFLTHWP